MPEMSRSPKAELIPRPLRRVNYDPSFQTAGRLRAMREWSRVKITFSALASEPPRESTFIASFSTSGGGGWSSCCGRNGIEAMRERHTLHSHSLFFLSLSKKHTNTFSLLWGNCSAWVWVQALQYIKGERVRERECESVSFLTRLS